MKPHWQLKAPPLTCPKCGHPLQRQRYKLRSKNPLRNNSIYYQCLSCRSYFYMPNRAVIRHILVLLLVIVPFVLLLQFVTKTVAEILVSKPVFQQLGMEYNIQNLSLIIASYCILIFFIVYLTAVFCMPLIGRIQSSSLVELPKMEIKQLTPLPAFPENNLIKDIKALSWRQRLILLLFTIAVIAALIWLSQNTENLRK